MKKLSLLCVTLTLLVAFAPPVLAQEELEGGSVLVEGDIVLDCAVFFDALERFQNDAPDTRDEQRNFEEAQGYVQLCTERGVVPPFDGSEAEDQQNASPPSSGSSSGSAEQAQAAPAPPPQAGTTRAQAGGKLRQLPATGGVSPLVVLGSGVLLFGSALFVRRLAR